MAATIGAHSPSEVTNSALLFLKKKFFPAQLGFISFPFFPSMFHRDMNYITPIQTLLGEIFCYPRQHFKVYPSLSVI